MFCAPARDDLRDDDGVNDARNNELTWINKLIGGSGRHWGRSTVHYGCLCVDKCGERRGEICRRQLFYSISLLRFEFKLSRALERLDEFLDCLLVGLGSYKAAMRVSGWL